jgi:hypothetical protein
MRSLRDMGDLHQHGPEVSIVRTDTGMQAGITVELQGLFVRGVAPVEHREEEEGVSEDAGHRFAVP